MEPLHEVFFNALYNNWRAALHRRYIHHFRKYTVWSIHMCRPNRRKRNDRASRYAADPMQYR